MKILVINGPNLNMLGIREPEIYGAATLSDLLEFLRETAVRLKVDVTHFQSNCEGEIVTQIQNAYGIFDAIVINPAAYTHTSIAILDALKAVSLPAVEVHLSDVNSREDFRKVSYTSMACIGTVSGEGFYGYEKAITMLINYKKE